MKIRFLFSVILISSVLFLSGCADTLIFLRALPPQTVILEYSAATDEEELPASFRNQDSVVSIVTIGNIKVGLTVGAIVNISSGVIIDQEGYVLAAYESAAPGYVHTDGNRYTGTATAVYAVLSDAYDTKKTLYKLKTIDVDPENGLALFQFYDHFYFDMETQSEENGLETKREAGFPIVAEISSLAVSVGEPCIAVGNSVGNVMNDLAYPFSMSDVYLSATSGVVASCNGNNAFDIAAAVVPEMCGGAVFDKNGYWIGLISEKLSSESSAADSAFLENYARCIDNRAIIAYLSSVSTKTGISVAYTVASLEEAA